MAKVKTREITIYESKGTFSIFRKKTPSKQDYDFEGIASLRKILSNEKARILHVIKTQEPESIYDLAKKLGRGFKSVSDDIQLLKRFGLIELYKKQNKKRIKHKPVIAADTITINLRI